MPRTSGDISVLQVGPGQVLPLRRTIRLLTPIAMGQMTTQIGCTLAISKHLRVLTVLEPSTPFARIRTNGFRFRPILTEKSYATSLTMRSIIPPMEPATRYSAPWPSCSTEERPFPSKRHRHRLIRRSLQNTQKQLE